MSNPRLARLLQALRTNRQFVAFVLVVAIALAFPGSPAGILLVGGSEPPSVALPARPQSDAPSAAPAPSPAASSSAPATPSPEEIADVVGEVAAGLELPPPEEEQPEPPCSTDAAVSAAAQVRAGLAGIAGTPIPGESIEDLAELVAGCSGASEMEVVLEVALELATYVPDTGIPPQDVPNLPPFPALPVPTAVIDALDPVAPAVKEGCAQLGTVALILLVVPPAVHLPVSQGDLIQFLAPANALCALFDDEAAP